jgi:hypothetical protein
MNRSILAAAVLGLAVAVGAPRARGGPLDPGAFTPLGTLNISGGSYTFNTTTDQLLDSSNNVLFTGVTFNGIAVFDFSQITISGGTFTATGSVGSTGMIGQPLALLSQGDINFTGGSINLDGGGGSNVGHAGGAGGSGGFSGGSSSISGPGGGGGGFGGGPGGPGGPGGGRPYGDLNVQLIGGSGGGSGSAGGGGGGGGAIELGASGSLTINGGTIAAGGGHGAGGLGGPNAGGGSGGGIFLHAASVSLAGSNVLNVSGGDGGSGVGLGGAGGGGGGRILILTELYKNTGTFNLAGGGGGGGAAGVLTITPEPSGLILLAMALPAAAYALRGRKPGSEQATGR